VYNARYAELRGNESTLCVQFMDEPTSGLDARSAAAVIDAVRNVAANGRTVMVTIHQPSIEIFEAFDRLVLLAMGGEPIFSGALGTHSSALVDYFQVRHPSPAVPVEAVTGDTKKQNNGQGSSRNTSIAMLFLKRRVCLLTDVLMCAAGCAEDILVDLTFPLFHLFFSCFFFCFSFSRVKVKCKCMHLSWCCAGDPRGAETARKVQPCHLDVGSVRRRCENERGRHHQARLPRQIPQQLAVHRN
jgi:hypothetical protein